MLKLDEINRIMAILGHDNDDYIIVREDLLRSLLAAAPRDVVLSLVGQPATADEAPNPQDPLVHKKVRRLRKANRITQERLATEATVKQPDISDFERNGPTGFHDRIPRILQALQRIIDGPKA